MTVLTGDGASSWSSDNARPAGSDHRRVLLVEHDQLTARTIASALTSRGYLLSRCRGHTALIAAKHTDLVLLDLDLPGIDGLDLLADLRVNGSTPVLAFSRREDVEVVVTALERGADDYLVAPFRPAELVARVNAITRRAVARRPPEQVLRVDDVEIRFHQRVLLVGGEPIRLSDREFDVLSVLARGAGAAVSRKDIMTAVWGHHDVAVSRNLDVYMASLRTKLNRPNLIATVRGFGYRLGRK